MKALILGEQIIQLQDKDFPVASPLMWVDAPDDTTIRDTWLGGVVKYVEPAAGAQDIRRPAVAAMQCLRDELALAISTNQADRINRIRREISRIKFMSQGV